MKMRCRKRGKELADELRLHSGVLRDRIRTIRTDTQNISTVGRYCAPDIQPARLERRRRLVGGRVGQAREAAEALVELVRRRPVVGVAGAESAAAAGRPPARAKADS